MNENIKKNNKMKKTLENTNIQVIYCSKDCEIFDKDFKKVEFLHLKNDKNIYSNINNNSLIYQMELYFKRIKALDVIYKSKKLPKNIKKNSIQFHPLFYPGINLP